MYTEGDILSVVLGVSIGVVIVMIIYYLLDVYAAIGSPLHRYPFPIEQIVSFVENKYNIDLTDRIYDKDHFIHK